MSADETLPAPRDAPGPLRGVRVLELADELAEYCGLLLAGLGAEVIKVEPPTGASTRAIGPFLHEQRNAEQSLHFWQYNRSKKSVVLDLSAGADYHAFIKVAQGADVILYSSTAVARMAPERDFATVGHDAPDAIVARISPFGDRGPWRDFKASDLIHLALGGVMMNCGYDPDLRGHFDLPPIAPQAWHSYHIAGEQVACAIAAALFYKLRSRAPSGQNITCAIHEAVAKNTELDVMAWVMRRVPLYRQTCRHSAENTTRTPTVSHTKDGRWYCVATMDARDENKLLDYLEQVGVTTGVEHRTGGVHSRVIPGGTKADPRSERLADSIQRAVRAETYDGFPWQAVQEAGIQCSPLRKPHENAYDPHWVARGTYADIEHPELKRSFRYPVRKWLSTGPGWEVGSRAPLLGEHTPAILSTPRQPRIETPAHPAALLEVKSVHGKPMALSGIRVTDFSWFLASAGGTRCLAALGAECLKIEWKAHPDTRMFAMAPIGGRAVRESATGPIPGVTDSDMGGQFNNKNAGKRGISLNVRHPRGLEIAKELVRISDVVAEGFSPGVMQRIGLGYDVLRDIKPGIIYAQQSGMGSMGKYGRFRATGPIAQALSGLSEMSGLPEPATPAGWGYSYLDWMGAHSFALSILTALYHRELTGEGQWIDASQSEVGLFLDAGATLAWSADGRIYKRSGNRAYGTSAAPHGAYPCRGEDRWLAIACFNDDQWRALCATAAMPCVKNTLFATSQKRQQNIEALDRAVREWTLTMDAYVAMLALQRAGVPAGVCQTAADRTDIDPQLAALQWMTEITGTKIGKWPVPEVPFRMDRTPPHIGGMIDRGAPCYGEDNEYVYGELLGLSQHEIGRLIADDII